MACDLASVLSQQVALVVPSLPDDSDCCITTVIPSNEEGEEASNLEAPASIDPANLQVSFVLQSYTLCDALELTITRA